MKTVYMPFKTHARMREGYFQVAGVNMVQLSAQFTVTRTTLKTEEEQRVRVMLSALML